jgi:ribonuclease J
MPKAKIYRGTKEIGGTCIQLTAENGKILWIDLGSPLDDSNPNIEYIKNSVDALLISHPHQDHFGLMENVGVDIPIYIGQVSLDLINATKIFRGIPQLNGNFKIVEPWKSYTLADTFLVTPFLTDHSTPESFAFLIEADGKRIFYSGDFRATGRKGQVYERLIKNPPKDIDLLFIEGTMIERTNHLYPSEKSVEQAIFNIINSQNNITFVISSAQNIDRFVSVFNACRKCGKYLVIDVYSAWVIESVRKLSKKTPGIEWEEIKVFDHPGQLEKIKDPSFDEFRKRISHQRAGNSVFKKPSDFIYFVRCPNKKLVDKLRSSGIINIIYSQWEGYLRDEHKNYCTDYINSLKNDPGISFHSVHTSGHATVPDLIQFAKAFKPEKIVPIHTSFPEIFKKEFEKESFTNIVLWDDNQEYQL